ncbi:MAG TPA: DUF2905 domain-containing protein [Polyangiaceae bacterium]|jgi:hypothetical protein|nr:DUF2905 domain-containing protein [Polyangiaceae bacterium]
MLPDSRPPGVGPLIVGVGLLIVVVGLLVWSGALSWFGRLPGDIRYESGSLRLYFPLVSMLLISILLSLISVAVRRFF